MERLPIDDVLPEILGALRGANALVLEAPPGAGKTTRVPIAMLDAGLVQGEILCLQPRRLAARLAASRVAEERGEKPGETIGWQVRFEDVSGPKTRLKFLTEGVLTRRLLSDPALAGVGAVVLDEFHERHLDGDLAAALLKRLQRARPELRIVVMSATLDAEPIAAWLGAARVRSEGRRFEVAIEYAEKEDDRPLAERVAGAVKRAIAAGLDGDVLVFLPGAAEIRRAGEALAEVAARQDLLVLPLHGDLPPAEQDRAVRPAPKRKVILSTNVAETSVTIDGVVVVIDSGLARIASLAPWSGIPVLAVAKVSRASAAQRAGRAGRTRPGRAIRLYTKHDHDTRPAAEQPEILRLDLAETVLSLRANGIAPETLDWFQPPPASALAAAETLLDRLGAIEPGPGSTPPPSPPPSGRGPGGGGDATTLRVSDRGRKMLRFPAHPRLARLILEAESRGAGEAGCLAAAILSERDLRRGDAAEKSGTSDVLEMMERFDEATRGGRLDPDRARRAGLDVGAAMNVERIRRQLERALSTKGSRPDPASVALRAPVGLPVGGARAPHTPDPDEPVRIATLAAYPDRVARKKGDQLALAMGGSAKLAPGSVVRETDLLVAIDVQERKDAGQGARGLGPPLVRTASAIEPEWLIDLFADRIRETADLAWNEKQERVEASTRMLFDGLVLDETKGSADPAAVAGLLREHALEAGPAAFAPEGEPARFLARIAFVREAAPDAALPPIGANEVRETLAALCEGRKSFAELRDASLMDHLRARLAPDSLRALDRLAPDRLTLPGGRGLRIEYEPGKPPWVASRLQDFFGMASGPAVAGGRVPVVLHLLAPNQRDLQVTTDLAGFWDRHYPAIRKELSRKYPRHAWPEDPRTAAPPAPRRR